ncbi:Thiamine-phosphate synthase [Usitatibacter rugosus]|uniref:Thiamine-phosphate synthase n=1 Tax=Usitatibacter rugosus TaxID=2732067 RepID=A0A6M4GP68_9PROT|nr:thiamine phosphate synthase [Usitatibacter rugosus]QJR09002.1 Thiamine-phosphate synthase [Usitatibacter rugosus]
MSADPALARRLKGLYAITPEREDTERLAREVEQALEGGAAVVQYRAKHADAALALEQARRLRDLCRAFGAPLIVNDSLDLALEIAADGVHLGRDDGDVRAARVAMPGRLIGVSCYDDPIRARRAAEDGADYIGIGSVFPSTTKPQAVRAALDRLGDARRASAIPVAAIGGITAANAAVAISSGADMVAVISAVFDAPDVRAAARSIAVLFPLPETGTPHA